jgi:hypothetical protein
MPAIWPFLLTVAHLTLVSADHVPALNIAPTCRATAAAAFGQAQDTDFCPRDERRARDRLEHSWDDYTARQRARCTSLARMGGAPSYVELLTCLEIAKAADALPDPPLDKPPGDVIRR